LILREPREADEALERETAGATELHRPLGGQCCGHQDQESRDLAITADNMTRYGTPRIAEVPQVFYPGNWSAQTAYNNRLNFDNGDYVENILTVLGQERVETISGSFMSWKAKISSNSAATGLIEGMDWWTPELGAPAKFSTVSKMPDGSEMRFVATLKSSNVR